MTNTASSLHPPEQSTAPRMRYGGLIAMMLMSFLLVTSEFLPNGVLTEMARGLGVTDGQAGQTVSITALAGLLAAPTVGLIFPRLDRRSLLTWMALLAAVSNLVVAFAPSFALLLAARFLLGVSISTFWAMSISVAARIAGPERLGRAVMFTSAGMSLATVAGVPIGVFFAGIVDWRVVFAGAGIAMVVLAAAVRLLLPAVPAARASSFAVLGDTLRRPGIALGFAGHVLVVLGHFVAYTYIRLAIERVSEVPGGAQLDAGTIVLLLALFGVGGLVGNVVMGIVVDRAFAVYAVLIPLLISGAVLTVAAFPGALWAVGTAIVVWGFSFASWLIVVNTWIGNRAPDRLEAGGSLVVVGFQGAIMLAAGVGGLLIDSVGVAAVYVAGAVTLVLGAILFGAAGGRKRG
ncbi:MFS transporter [Leucobacter luti]|uniref:Putative MFS family arabinose efflux permease n=1 Tax=Leucobacter luti TaxID=340320 RepID=A0A4Q7U6D4_9MICO|nr:MFS transporter [Leucobacter luti]MBL3700519.1 MFS transporter [Leucobacter luti]RZT68647.1 putative MFS family arabinose efflux permease [Leucobacter luti]